MKQTALILILTAGTLAASAQTPAPPAASPAKPATAAAKPAGAATAAKPAIAAAKPATAAVVNPNIAPIIKAPAKIPPVKGLQKTLFTTALRYQDVKAGDGASAESGKLAKCLFTLWLEDGSVFDSTDDHRAPVLDKDHKPVVGDDGKPKLGDPQPISFLIGQGRPIPGWDLGMEGMKAHGVRRIFIPWQFGFGDREIPARDATHTKVPAKSNLILQVELTDVTDAPQMAPRPGMPPGGMHPMPNGHPMPPNPGAPGAPGAIPNSTMKLAPPSPAAPAPPTPPAAPAAPAAPVAPTAPAAPAAPAAPSAPAQPSK